MVLAGGLGTRIRGVLGDTPKVLAPVNGRPYLDHLLDHLAADGARGAVLALGHLADKVKAHLESRPPPLPVRCVVEPAPLGTGGALRHAVPAIEAPDALVMNGDTWVDTDLGAFVAAWRASGRDAALLGVQVDDISRFGSIKVAADGSLAAFVEKDPDMRGAGLINGGVYLFSRGGLTRVTQLEGASLERDMLARMPAGSTFVYVAEKAGFVDIGTPESLAGAGNVMPGRAREKP